MGIRLVATRVVDRRPVTQAEGEVVADPTYLDLVSTGLFWALGKLDDKGEPDADYVRGQFRSEEP